MFSLDRLGPASLVGLSVTEPAIPAFLSGVSGDSVSSNFSPSLFKTVILVFLSKSLNETFGLVLSSKLPSHDSSRSEIITGFISTSRTETTFFRIDNFFLSLSACSPQWCSLL